MPRKTKSAAPPAEPQAAPAKKRSLLDDDEDEEAPVLRVNEDFARRFQVRCYYERWTQSMFACRPEPDTCITAALSTAAQQGARGAAPAAGQARCCAGHPARRTRRQGLGRVRGQAQQPAGSVAVSLARPPSHSPPACVWRLCISDSDVDDEEEASDSESESEEGQLDLEVCLRDCCGAATPDSPPDSLCAQSALDDRFLETLLKIRRRDPSIYEPGAKLLADADDDEDEDGGDEQQPAKSKQAAGKAKKPVYLREVQAQQLLQRAAQGGDASDSSDEEEPEDAAALGPTYVEEQEAARRAFLAAVDGEEAGEEEGHALLVRSKSARAVALPTDMSRAKVCARLWLGAAPRRAVF